MTKQSQDNEARLVQEQSEELQEVFSNLPPEVQEWVRRTFPKEEVLRDLLDVRAKGGFPLSQILPKLEQMVNGK
jgi:hypothetical protein